MAALLALIVLLALAAGAWFLLVDDDSGVEAVDESSPPTSAPATGDDAGTGVGEVFAGGQRVLPGGEGQLTRFVGQPAEGRTVRVLSVPADEDSGWGRATRTACSCICARTGGVPVQCSAA